MGSNTDAPAQNPPHVLHSAIPESNKVGERNFSDFAPMLSPLLVDDGSLTKSDEEGITDATGVQRPFSLADHVVERNVAPSGSPLFVRCPKGGLLRLGFAACDLGAGDWELLPSPFIVKNLPEDFAGTFGGICSGGGLVLMEKCGKQQHHIVISNPTSELQRQLPPMMDFSKPQILGIFVDLATAGYKIPVIHRNFNEKEMDLVVMQEYNSVSNSWEFAGQWRNRFQEEPIGAAYVNETLFFLTYDRQSHVAGFQQRVHHIYYLSDLVWERLELPLGLGSLGFPAIFEYGGRLMLAGGLQTYDSGNLKCSSDVSYSVCVWEHEWSLMRWMDVCNMPGSWVDELYKSAPEERGLHTLEVTAGGDFLCVASSNGKASKCDLTKNEWAWLPKCEVARYADGDKILILERRPDIPV